MDAEAALRDVVVRLRQDERCLAGRGAEVEGAVREALRLGPVGALTAMAAHEEQLAPAWADQPEQVVVKPPELMEPELAERQERVLQAWRQREEPLVAEAEEWELESKE